MFRQFIRKGEGYDDNSTSNMTRIIEKVFSEKKYSKVEMAYVIAICTTTLNPNRDELQLKESVMKCKVEYYLVGFFY